MVLKQKHFIDIQNIREEDTELRNRNTYAFDKPCEIVIQEKADGSNACICYDSETDSIVAFSRKQELSFQNTLNGFWNFVQSLSDDVKQLFKDHPNWRVFGEWMGAKNKIVYYDTGKVKHWYVYDIYDTNLGIWLEQDTVSDFCKLANFEYINVLYRGKFISWEHCRSFMNSPAYGNKQEGIVVKRTGLDDWDSHDIKAPCYLKIVNEDFKESMKTKEKIVDPEKENAKAEARRIMESICTQNRIEKELHKMRDEGILPDKIEPTDFRTVAMNLPKRIYADLLKEELELVQQCGEFGGKMCQQVSMSIAKDLILGK